MNRWLGRSLRALCTSIPLLAGPLAAQTGNPPVRGTMTTVTGVVRDSIERVALAGATVQLVDTDPVKRFARTTIADSLGRFSIDSVPDGRYSLGFFHAALEPLGIEPPVRELSISGQGQVRSDLGTPSRERFLGAVCGSKKQSDSAAVVVGVVRDARDFSAAGGVTVTGEWLELTFSKQGVVRKLPSLIATTAGNGWFALCGVPSPGTMTIRASRGADSIDLIDVDIPAHGVVREELFLGTTRVADASPRVDSGAAALPLLRTGNGHLSGTVVSAESGRALAGARVAIVGGPQTRANERGEWALGNAPVGTRMLEVRSVGYYPERRAVNVVSGAAPISVRLSTMKAVLATIRVSASRLRYDLSGFQDRRRSVAGRFITAEEVARRGAIFTSELLRRTPSVTLERDDLIGEEHILMRGPYGKCAPTIFLNGSRMSNLSADDIDDLISPKEIAGIEIYSEAAAPAQFRESTRMDVCGSVVIWRK